MIKKVALAPRVTPVVLKRAELGETVYKLKPHIEGTQLVLITSFKTGPFAIRISDGELKQIHRCFDLFEAPIRFDNDENCLLSVYSTFVKDPQSGTYKLKSMDELKEGKTIGKLIPGDHRREFNKAKQTMSKVGGRFLKSLGRNFEVAKSYPPEMGIALQWKRYHLEVPTNPQEKINYGFHGNDDSLDHGMSLSLNDTYLGGDFNIKPRTQRSSKPALSVRPKQYEAVLFGNNVILYGITTPRPIGDKPTTRDVLFLHTYIPKK